MADATEDAGEPGAAAVASGELATCAALVGSTVRAEEGVADAGSSPATSAWEAADAASGGGAVFLR
ncbi:hypothetical protein, partial [Aquabacterium sp. UBA2148]|uniref:hypothetical protein n=1 Tax=Aquabacterium sp. UBA2148 TaxID=1946042 RepID=UPI00257F1DDB